MWGIAIRPSTEFQTGKDIFIYDCNTEIIYGNILKEDNRLDTTKLYKSDLLSMQFNLLNFLQKKKRYNIRRVYMGGQGNQDDGICFKLTGHWIRRMTSTTTTDLPLTPTEAAEQGWKKVAWQRNPQPKTQTNVTVQLTTAAPNIRRSPRN